MGIRDRGEQSAIVKLVDSAVKRQGPKAVERAAEMRAKNPGASTAELVEKLTTDYRRLSTGAGAGVGATAAVPGIGTVTSVLLSVAEAGTFLETAARYVLTRAVLQDCDPGTFEGRRGLVMGAMLGAASVRAAQEAASGTRRAGDLAWAKALSAQRQAGSGKFLNSLTGKFVTRFAIRRGAGLFGRAFPFGVGAVLGGVANWAGANTVIEGADAAFGPAS